MHLGEQVANMDNPTTLKTQHIIHTMGYQHIYDTKYNPYHGTMGYQHIYNTQYNGYEYI